MPKYTETPANTVIDARWYKRIANECAETNRLLRILIGPRDAGNIPGDDGS